MSKPAVVVCGREAYELLVNGIEPCIKHGLDLTGLPVVRNETICQPDEIKVYNEGHPLTDILLGRRFVFR